MSRVQMSQNEEHSKRQHSEENHLQRGDNKSPEFIKTFKKKKSNGN